MNDGMLSQEEIDALLRDDDELIQNENQIDRYLSPIEQDALGEIGNISFGSAATAISTLLNYKVDITTPKVSLIFREELDKEFPIPYISVFVKFTAGLKGSNVLMIKTQDAKIIADIMLGGDGLNPRDNLDEIQLSAVQEAMNQMMGSSATSMSTVFNKKVDISPPALQLMDGETAKSSHLPQDDQLIKVAFNLRIGDLVDSEIMQLIPIRFARELVETLMVPPPMEDNLPRIQGSQKSSHLVDKINNGIKASKVQETGRNEIEKIQPAIFSDFDDHSTPKLSEPKNLELLLDIPLKVTVELGKAERSVKEILNLGPGSVVELDKLAGEHVDILINNKPIAKGEVVVIDENFGVRVTEILSQQERLKKLH